MAQDFREDVESIERIEAVTTILDVIIRTTGMGFAAVARVTEDRWVACSVFDQIDFGLKPGDELKIETTICHEIRQNGEPVCIDDVTRDTRWSAHHTPALYGFRSYISVPIVLSDGAFFGTLCAIDPRPAKLNSPEILGMFRLFAQLIAKNIEAQRALTVTQSALTEERAVAELREQFIAVLAHDLRSPARSVSCLAEVLAKRTDRGLDGEASQIIRLMRESSSRMLGLIDNLLDFARARLGGGLPLERNGDEPLEPVLRGVIAELNVSHPGRAVYSEFALREPVDCDRGRMAQVLSNLLGNALAYGARDRPIHVLAICDATSLELSVSNEGEPIPQEAHEHLFQPFYRSAVAMNREGLGLGLYITHEIARAHGGTLTVESMDAETSFTFRIPLPC